MVRVFVFLIAVHVVLLVLALIDCLSAERSRIRSLPRFLWVLVVILLPLLGSVAWFLAGRPTKLPPGGAPMPGPAGRPRPKPSAPDDDPDFLSSLDAEQSRKDRELFERWEADLKRREDELRREDESRPEDEPRRGDEPRREDELRRRDNGERPSGGNLPEA